MQSKAKMLKHSLDAASSLSKYSEGFSDKLSKFHKPLF